LLYPQGVGIEHTRAPTLKLTGQQTLVSLIGDCRTQVGRMAWARQAGFLLSQKPMGMKRVFGAGTVITSLLMASTASAIPIADVGAVDTFRSSANLGNSGTDTEKAWIAAVLGVSVNSFTYTQLPGSGSSVWEQVTGGPGGTNLYAFDFQDFGASNPAFFLIKTGNLQVTNYDHFLYENVAQLRYGVIDLNDFGNDLTILVGKISHVGTAGGTNPPNTPAPEPATLLLLGSGLALTARHLRRRARK
jgi:PEP-CTERM motif